MNDIQIFNNPEFGQVRTVMIDGEPWFCGKDIAGTLGYANEKNAIKRHCDDGEVTKRTLGVQTGYKKDGSPAMMDVEAFFINESGLYSLIFGSKLESAKKFKKWVTSEVLPQLRKTGTYGTPKLPQTPMELLELHYEAIKQVDRKVNTLDDRLNKLEADMPVFNIDAKNIQSAVRKKGIAVLGGKTSNAYKDKSTRTCVYADIQCMLRRNFGVRRYEEIRHCKTDVAIQLVEEYIPPLILQEKVEMVNSQLNLNL